MAVLEGNGEDAVVRQVVVYPNGDTFYKKCNTFNLDIAAYLLVKAYEAGEIGEE